MAGYALLSAGKLVRAGVRDLIDTAAPADLPADAPAPSRSTLEPS